MRIKSLLLAMIGVMLLSVGSWAQAYPGAARGKGSVVSSYGRSDKGFHRREHRKHRRHHRRHHHHGHSYRGR